MKIIIDDVEFGGVTEFNVRRELRKTEIRYNTQGDMLIDMVARKYALEVSFGLMTESELKKLRSLTGKIFVNVVFQAPEGELMEEFHISEEPAAEVKMVNGVRMYGGVKLTMLQK